MLLTSGYVLAGKYEIVRLAERGGMALLYEARHKELNLPLALKILMATQESDPVQTGYFQNEARALAQLRHPGVPSIVDLGTLDGHPYLLMEWLEGETLGVRLKRLGRMELSAVLPICQQVGSVLVAAHERGIVHRDLKPGNLFLYRRFDLPEVVKVLDFGIARVPAATGVERPPTVQGTLLGTPEYMSPEQACGDMMAIGPHTDQYALGMLAYAMLRGQPAFVPRDASPDALIQHLIAVQKEAPPPLGEHVGVAVAACIMKALGKRPSDRFATVQDFLKALVDAQKKDAEAPTRSGATTALAASPAAQPPPPAPPAPPAQSSSVRRRPATWRSVALFAIVFVLGAVGGYSARRPAPTQAMAVPERKTGTVEADGPMAGKAASPTAIAHGDAVPTQRQLALPDLAPATSDRAGTSDASPTAAPAIDQKVTNSGTLTGSATGNVAPAVPTSPVDALQQAGRGGKGCIPIEPAADCITSAVSADIRKSILAALHDADVRMCVGDRLTVSGVEAALKVGQAPKSVPVSIQTDFLFSLRGHLHKAALPGEVEIQCKR